MHTHIQLHLQNIIVTNSNMLMCWIAHKHGHMSQEAHNFIYLLENHHIQLHTHGHKLPYSNIFTHKQGHTENTFIPSLLANMLTCLHILINSFIEMIAVIHFNHTDLYLKHPRTCSHIQCYTEICSHTYLFSHTHSLNTLKFAHRLTHIQKHIYSHACTSTFTAS